MDNLRPLKWEPEDAANFLGSLTPRKAVRTTASEYYAAHRSQLKLASQLQDDNHFDGLFALAHATYGWMPTMLKSFEPLQFNCSNPITTVRSITNINDGRAFLDAICDPPPINKSWVGTSKLLHFINPEIFPIWDSKVALNFGIKFNQQINRRFSYLKYFDFVHAEIAKGHEWILPVIQEIQSKHGYGPTRTRAIELMLFERMREQKN